MPPGPTRYWKGRQGDIVAIHGSFTENFFVSGGTWVREIQNSLLRE